MHGKDDMAKVDVAFELCTLNPLRLRSAMTQISGPAKQRRLVHAVPKFSFVDIPSYITSLNACLFASCSRLPRCAS
jgi:hypothetical protein